MPLTPEQLRQLNEGNLGSGSVPDDQAAIQQPTISTSPTVGQPVIVDLSGRDPDPVTGPIIAPTYGEDRPISQVQGDQDFRVDLRNFMESYYEKLEEDLGLSKFTIGTFVEQNWEHVIGKMDWVSDGEIGSWVDKQSNFLQINEAGDSVDAVDFVHKQAYINGKLNPYSVAGLSTLQSWATKLMDNMLGIDSVALSNSARRTTGGARGRSKPTPEQLRNQFDVNALASNIKDIWRAYMAEEPPNAKAMAKAYVEEVVKTGGEKQIDFKEYVLGNARNTGRWKTLYATKPEGVDELRHMAPYIAAAQQAIGASAETNRFSQLVLEGAGLGASAQDFASKLQREDPVRESAGFISGLENTVAGIKGILRG